MIVGGRLLIQWIELILLIDIIYHTPMNLRDLRYLVALADDRHFGRAAQSSSVSQPTFSAQIRKLEEN